MKAAVMRAQNAPLSLEEVRIDDPGPGEVLIKTAASGICHSDLHVIEGGLPMPPPVILGHEPRASSRRSARASPTSRPAIT
jgi:S-(hydroxymethyl)glutathione dehydrogenase/alcohol dehydrogenase